MRKKRPELRKLHYHAFNLVGYVGFILNLSGLCQPATGLLALRGEVTTEILSPWGTNSDVPTRAEFVVTTSNRLWEIELLYKSPENVRGTGESCMRVADGIRVRPVFPGLTKNALLPAVALPIAYPQPGRTDPFACWLGLVAESELPVIAGSRIRRFLDVKFQRDPQNEGTFAVEYLDSSRRYLKSLAITNNGALFTADGKVVHYRGLLAPGFLELKYETTETTNWNGMTLPCRGVLARFALKPYAKTPGDLYTTVRSEFKVEELVTVSENQERPRLSTWPSKYMALDKRFPDVYRSVGINYIVTNDAWNSTTNADLSLLAHIARKTRSRFPARKVFWCLAFLAVTAAPVAFYLLAFRRRRRAADPTTVN